MNGAKGALIRATAGNNHGYAAYAAQVPVVLDIALHRKGLVVRHRQLVQVGDDSCLLFDHRISVALVAETLYAAGRNAVFEGHGQRGESLLALPRIT